MKKIIFGIAFILCAQFAMAQGKTAYISTDAVFANIPQVKIADSLIELEKNKLNDVYNERNNELNDLIALFVKDSINMAKEVKEAKRISLQGKLTDLEKSKQLLNEQLEDFKEKQYAPIREKVFKEIAAFSKAKGFATVLYRESAVIIPPNSDITLEIIKKMGGKVPQQK
jgi:Skp family chaperone for outer membrane proteins